ncbi:MAG: hypothetical protein IE926_01925 [Micrococcales bacterium]|nr:hypothetical protein [Micrococcales bacterium]
MPAVTAALIGELSPPLVQVVVTGLVVGDEYEVTGSLGDQSWTVRAGVGVATSTQVVLVDVAAPVNAPVTYTVSIPEDAVTASSTPIVVPWAPGARASSRYLLSSLDGQLTAALRWLNNGDPRDHNLRVAFHTVEGRSRPVPVYDLEAGESRTYVVVTDGDHTAAMRELVRSGAPLLLRTDGSVADFAPCDYIQLKSAASILRRGTTRKWTLGLEVIDDPEPNTLLAASTWDDFDAAYASLTWAGFDGDWAGQAWNDFDREDWDSRA